MTRKHLPLFVKLPVFVTKAAEPVAGIIFPFIGKAHRNRSEFVEGQEAVVAFLQRKWAKELEYRLIKELWAFDGARIAVRFAYEWKDDSGNWSRPR